MYFQRESIQSASSIRKSILKVRSMNKGKSGEDLILDALKDKSIFKQNLYQKNLDVFIKFKSSLKKLINKLNDSLGKKHETIDISFKDKGSFECEVIFGGDILIFSIHTNIFNFDDNHFIHKTDYVKEDPNRGYCGMIQVYNFLKDSIKYKRMNDVGYLIARVFINDENHFFVEGKRQLGFLYNDFDHLILTDKYVKAIIESAILYTIDFDLLVPPYQSVKQITVIEKLQEEGMTALKTGKRLGFKFQADSDLLQG